MRGRGDEVVVVHRDRQVHERFAIVVEAHPVQVLREIVLVMLFVAVSRHGAVCCRRPSEVPFASTVATVELSLKRCS
jgi:hypothetical protein